MKNIAYSLIISLCVLPLVVNGAIVEGLYEAEIVVPNQSKSVRKQAMSKGLAEVFAKVSGNPNVSSIDGITEATEKAGRYLQQFLYRRPSEIRNVDPTAGRRSQILWLRFDEKSINKILRDNSLPVWGRTRPSTLVWLAVEQDGGRFMLGSDSKEELARSLKFQAKRQGLALVLPLLDLQDQRIVKFSDVWGGFPEPIQNASRRYQAEAILIGRMSLSRSDVWTTRWSLYEGSEPLSWESQGQQADELLQYSLARVTDTLASRYAVVLDDDSSGEVKLAVYGVGSLEQFVKVSDYLRSLQPVKAVQPMRVAANAARYRVKIRGNPDGLIRIIALGSVLKSDPMASQGSGNTLSSGNTTFGKPGQEEYNEYQDEYNDEYMYRLMP